MSTTLTVEIDLEVALRKLRPLGANACQQAWRRTLKKSSRWIATQSAKTISQQTQIPQKIIKKRLYFFPKSSTSGKGWLGLNPIEAHHLGKPKQTRTGVTVGRHRFAGAWLMRYRAPNGPVFRRLSPKSTVYRKITIVSGLQRKLKTATLIAAYPDIQRTLELPAILIELTELEPGDDPGTGETALLAHLQARIIVDPTRSQAELGVRELAAQVAVALTHEQWGLPITQAKLSRIGEALIKPDLEGYLAWSVEWSHELHLGAVVWPYPDESGVILAVGFTPDPRNPTDHQLIGEL